MIMPYYNSLIIKSTPEMVKHADVSVDDIALHNSLIIKSTPEMVKRADVSVDDIALPQFTHYQKHP